MGNYKENYNITSQRENSAQRPLNGTFEMVCPRPNLTKERGSHYNCILAAGQFHYPVGIFRSSDVENILNFFAFTAKGFGPEKHTFRKRICQVSIVVFLSASFLLLNMSLQVLHGVTQGANTLSNITASDLLAGHSDTGHYPLLQR